MGLDRLRGGGHAFPLGGAAIETQLATITKIQLTAIHCLSLTVHMAEPVARLIGYCLGSYF